MVAKSKYFNTDLATANVPLWRESYSGLDWLALRYSPTYYGLGVPRGDGSPVVVVPGFLASDIYLQEMRFWLLRVGYRPYTSSIGRNADCLDVLDTRLGQTIDKAYQQTGRKVHLIGHSLGGLLSLAAAVRWPEKVASVITMGSPFRGIRSHPLVMQASDRVRDVVQRQPGCFSGECNCSTSQALRRPPAPTVPVSAIYTKSDGVVDWHYCITDNPANNFEVRGTHIGLAFNPAVYRLIGQQLANKRQAA